MHNIFIAQKPYCACLVLSLANIRSKYYFNFILNRTIGHAENFLIALVRCSRKEPKPEPDSANGRISGKPEPYISVTCTDKISTTLAGWFV